MSPPVLLQPARADDYKRDGWWPDRTLLDFFDDAVRKSPGKIAVVAGAVRLTYRQLADLAADAAQALSHAGLQAGDVISLQLPNCAEFVVAHLAATRLGAVTNPLLPNYRANELRYILATARTKIVVTVDRYRGFDFTPMYEELRSTLPDLLQVFTVQSGSGEPLDRCVALFAKRLGSETPSPLTSSSDDLASLIFTSGTEAKPKGVMHSHNTMLYGTLQMAKLLGLTADDVIWIPSPVGHGTGFQWGVRQAITLGATMVLQDYWDPQEALRLIETERCTFVLSATPFAAALAEAALVEKHDTSSLRIFGCAGAPIPRQLGAKAEAALGCALIGMWGMSECFVASASAPTDGEERRWGSDGRAMPGGELAVFDETRTRQLPSGEAGELATRGPFVALGYFKDPERTAATFSSEGWLFSGDLATIDEDGFIRLVGRMKEIINRGGLKVSTKEIEDLLLLHPCVDQVAVAPVSDEKLGETGCACIVLKHGGTLSFSEMIAYLERHDIAKYKLPEGLALLDALPFTPSGKIQKALLRQRLERGEISVSGRAGVLSKTA